MSGSAGAIMQGSGAMKADLVSDQQRLEAETDNIIGETERLIVWLAVGGFVLGGLLALLLGRGISKPMTAMCKAMREPPAAISTSCSRGSGGRTSSARWRARWRVQAGGRRQGRTRRRHPGYPEQGGRRRTPHRNSFASPMIRDGGRRDRFQRLGLRRASGAGRGHTDADSEKHPAPVEPGHGPLGRSVRQYQSVASATEELSVSVDEIGRQVRESNRIAEAAVAPGRADRTGVSANCRVRRRRSATSSS